MAGSGAGGVAGLLALGAFGQALPDLRLAHDGEDLVPDVVAVDRGKAAGEDAADVPVDRAVARRQLDHAEDVVDPEHIPLWTALDPCEGAGHTLSTAALGHAPPEYLADREHVV